MTGTAVPAAGPVVVDVVVVVVVLFLEVEVAPDWDKSDMGTVFVALLLGGEVEGMQKHGKRRWRRDGLGGDGCGWVFAAGSEDGCGCCCCWVVDWGVVVGGGVGTFVGWDWVVATAVAVEESAATKKSL